MKKVIQLISACMACGAASVSVDAAAYNVKVHEFEGCECNSVCPCIFNSDTTFGDCRATLVFTFTGSYGETTLKDTPCVVAVTKSGHNMGTTMGSWTGVVYMTEEATAGEKEAVHAILNDMMGPAFAKLESRTAPIEIKQEGDVHELVMGDIAHLKIHTMRGATGGVTVVENAPSPLAFPSMVCSVADVHTYNDGTASWSFPGRNGFSSDIELKGE